MAILSKMKHPFEPLSKEEIEAASTILRASFKGQAKRILFSNAQLVEPTKEEIGQFNNDGIICPRKVRLVGRGDESTFGSGGFSAIIDLTNKKLEGSVKLLPLNAQAQYNFADLDQLVSNGDLYESLRRCPEFVAAMKKRGIPEQQIREENIQIDAWPGDRSFVPKGHGGMRAILFYKERPDDNIYGRPIENVIVHIDLTSGEVANVEDHGLVPLSPREKTDQYDDNSLPPPRTTQKPLDIIQPDGPSFHVDGHHVKWEKWDFHISMHPIHGLALHNVSYQGRPILFRAALGDMVVPYGDPSPMHCWKHVFDASEYSLGNLVNSLELGCDCLGEIHYFDTHQINLGTIQ